MEGVVAEGTDECVGCVKGKRGIFDACYRLPVKGKALVDGVCANCKWVNNKCESWDDDGEEDADY